MHLGDRYAQIWRKFDSQSDFQEHELAKSRSFFDLDDERITPRRFDVWTCLVGIPLPLDISLQFQNIVKRVKDALPSYTRFYSVPPSNYHWELFIIKRPHDVVDGDKLLNTARIVRRVLEDQQPFSISYQGFLITTEGVVIVKGYGEFDNLRKRLAQKIPFTSSYQSSLGHVSLGRILDSVGDTRYTELKRLVYRSQNEFYGELWVNSVKYVHETQWYMEEREFIAEIPLGAQSAET